MAFSSRSFVACRTPSDLQHTIYFTFSLSSTLRGSIQLFTYSTDARVEVYKVSVLITHMVRTLDVQEDQEEDSLTTSDVMVELPRIW